MMWDVKRYLTRLFNTYRSVCLPAQRFKLTKSLLFVFTSSRYFIAYFSFAISFNFYISMEQMFKLTSGRYGKRASGCSHIVSNNSTGRLLGVVLIVSNNSTGRLLGVVLIVLIVLSDGRQKPCYSM